jgi:hypothetical protein
VSAAITALYTAAVLFVPIAHAATEAVASVPSLEAAHTDDCARLHGGAACHVLATLNMAHPSPPTRGVPDGSSAADASAPHHVDPSGLSVSLSAPARAPPQR